MRNLRENLLFGHFWCKNTLDYRAKKIKKSAMYYRCNWRKKTLFRGRGAYFQILLLKNKCSLTNICNQLCRKNLMGATNYLQKSRFLIFNKQKCRDFRQFRFPFWKIFLYPGISAVLITILGYFRDFTTLKTCV